MVGSLPLPRKLLKEEFGDFLHLPKISSHVAASPLLALRAGCGHIHVYISILCGTGLGSPTPEWGTALQSASPAACTGDRLRSFLRSWFFLRILKLPRACRWQRACSAAKDQPHRQQDAQEFHRGRAWYCCWYRHKGIHPEWITVSSEGWGWARSWAEILLDPGKWLC